MAQDPAQDQIPNGDATGGGITCSAWLPILGVLLQGCWPAFWASAVVDSHARLISRRLPDSRGRRTDLFEVMISGLYGAGSYTLQGRTELVAAIIMLVAPPWAPRSVRSPPVHQGLRDPHRLRAGRDRLLISVL